MIGFDNLNPVFASRVQALIAASGGLLGPGSGFRTVEEQIALRKSNGCPDVWSSPASSCRVPTAIPGRSNHNSGLAMDLVDSSTGRAVQAGSAADEWLAANAERFGLGRTVPGEAWHVEMVDGADIPGGPNLEWATEARNPEDELTSRLDQIMAVLGGGTEDSDAFQAVETPEDPLRMDTTTIPGTQPAGGGGSGNEFGDYALAQFQKYGWDQSELQALIRLWNKESGDPNASGITWNPGADNPNSSAQGIAQKMQSVHGPVESTWQGQIDWGLGYIAQRYGSPSKALQFHLQNNWY